MNKNLPNLPFLPSKQARFSFPLHFSERKLLLATVDLLLLNLALLCIVALRPNISLTWSVIEAHLFWYLFLSGLWLTVGLMLDIYDLARAASPFHSAWATSRAVLLTSLFYWFTPYLTPTLPSRRLEVLLFLLLTTLSIALWRVLYATLLFQPTFRQSALIIGSGHSARTLIQTIAATGGEKGNPIRGTGYYLLGIISQQPLAEQTIESLPVLGEVSALPALVRLLQPDEIIVATEGKVTQKTLQAILGSRELGIPITTMTTLYERVTGRVPVEHADDNLDVVLPMRRATTMRLYLMMARIFDLVITLLSLPLLIILMPLIWLANHLTDPGDLFYQQERVGKRGQPFQIYKFRTMVIDAEKETGAVWASEKDSRITPIGRFLRQTRLDELPQLWNVLKGEMSLIGPRPERPHFVSQLSQQIPFYRARHAVKPGLTGWAQVKYRYGASAEDALMKLQYDLYYIKHQGAYLDLLILLKTVQVMLGRRGR
jgi:exopolysaccharide biosynthesis polyprenyl glycosylphosphotransferase